METELTTPLNPAPRTFETGSVVFYGMHGRCQILGVETRTVSGESVPFYKMEVIRNTIAKPVNKKEPAIYLPVSSAQNRGLRTIMTAAEMEAANAIFSSREYYFQLGQ